MESTSVFHSALQTVYDSRRHKSDEDRRMVGRVLANPEMRDGRNGQVVDVLKKLHLRLRKRLHATLDIDVDTWIQWIKDHWLQILQAIAAILTIMMLI